jgi:hypothetical protein
MTRQPVISRIMESQITFTGDPPSMAAAPGHVNFSKPRPPD